MIELTLSEIGERGNIGEPLLEESGTIPDVLQALDTFLLSNEQHGRAFDLTILVHDEAAPGRLLTDPEFAAAEIERARRA